MANCPIITVDDLCITRTTPGWSEYYLLTTAQQALLLYKINWNLTHNQTGTARQQWYEADDTQRLQYFQEAFAQLNEEAEQAKLNLLTYSCKYARYLKLITKPHRPPSYCRQPFQLNLYINDIDFHNFDDLPEDYKRMLRYCFGDNAHQIWDYRSPNTKPEEEWREEKKRKTRKTLLFCQAYITWDSVVVSLTPRMHYPTQYSSKPPLPPTKQPTHTTAAASSSSNGMPSRRVVLLSPGNGAMLKAFQASQPPQQSSNKPVSSISQPVGFKQCKANFVSTYYLIHHRSPITCVPKEQIVEPQPECDQYAALKQLVDAISCTRCEPRKLFLTIAAHILFGNIIQPQEEPSKPQNIVMVLCKAIEQLDQSLPSMRKALLSLVHSDIPINPSAQAQTAFNFIKDELLPNALHYSAQDWQTLTESLLEKCHLQMRINTTQSLWKTLETTGCLVCLEPKPRHVFCSYSAPS